MLGKQGGGAPYLNAETGEPNARFKRILGAPESSHISEEVCRSKFGDQVSLEK